MYSRTKTRDCAVSPVVGVMLMLVVTIIIAAVVSAFAGGMGKTTDKAPQASFEVHIANDGTWGGSGFDLAVKGTSDAIPTKDLKIITDWKTPDGSKGGSTITGPNTIAGIGNTHYGTTNYHSPPGFGPGVQCWTSSGGFYVQQHFGNYSLLGGTRMHSSAYGSMTVGNPGYGTSPSTRWTYTNGSAFNVNTDVDGMGALLGSNWNILRPGDVVHMKVLHVPTGKVLYDGKITVEG